MLARRGASELSSLHSELAAHRPVFTSDGTQAFLRFDGEDDFLALSGPRQLAPAVTVLILAAPRGNKGFYPGFFACGSSCDFSVFIFSTAHGSIETSEPALRALLISGPMIEPYR